MLDSETPKPETVKKTFVIPGGRRVEISGQPAKISANFPSLPEAPPQPAKPKPEPPPPPAKSQ